MRLFNERRRDERVMTRGFWTLSSPGDENWRTGKNPQIIQIMMTEHLEHLAAGKVKEKESNTSRLTEYVRIERMWIIPEASAC